MLANADRERCRNMMPLNHNGIILSVTYGANLLWGHSSRIPCWIKYMLISSTSAPHDIRFYFIQRRWKGEVRTTFIRTQTNWIRHQRNRFPFFTSNNITRNVPWLSEIKSRAFDCLPHGLLIAKLHAYGCSMSACELISNYLSNRQQCVKTLNNRSTRRTLSKGVPQGSILGPLLFNVFMNDMFLFMKSCNFYNYAADNFVSRSSPDVNVILSNLKSDCQISLNWFDDNGMKANPSKFKFMIMSSENIEPQILTISDDVCLQSQTDVKKVLGITVDYRLTFNEHIRKCTLKAARQLNALSRISKYLDTKSFFLKCSLSQLHCQWFQLLFYSLAFLWCGQ